MLRSTISRGRGFLERDSERVIFVGVENLEQQAVRCIQLFEFYPDVIFAVQRH